MTIKGKGFYIWKIPEVEKGDAGAIATMSKQAGFTHVIIKIADGDHAYNVSSSGSDLVSPVARALKARGIAAWGWHYVYGYDPTAEANIAIQRLKQLNLDGYVIDAEAEYAQPGRDAAARTFMSRLRSAFPNFPVALSSYRYPSYHPLLPWSAFLEKCNYNMPQVYWLQNHNPGEQLTRSVSEFQALVPFRPVVPTGAAFQEHGWAPTPDDVIEFMQTAQSLNLSAVNFWEWANCRTYLPKVWEAIKTYDWSAPPFPLDITQKYIAALNSHDPNQVMALYAPNAVHVTASRTLQGVDSIRLWYSNLFAQDLPNAVFTLTNFSGTGSSRHLTWTATSSAGNVQNGNDTFGLMGDKITYHYTSFTVA